MTYESNEKDQKIVQFDTGSPSELEASMRAWEAGTLPLSAWTHAAHVGMAAYYAWNHEREETYHRARQGIHNYAKCQGIVQGPDSGYHETLTRFWCEVVWKYVHEGRFATCDEAARAAMQHFGETRYYLRYYSFDVLKNRDARQRWMEPDLQPIG